jgi:hypothetical protein
MTIAGHLGSHALPPSALAFQDGADRKFTVIGNPGALELAKAT